MSGNDRRQAPNRNKMSVMTVEVLSPFSGRPVKVRPQDVGRAVRDEAGRLFYVLPRPDGSGYYSAPSRAGGQRDIDRYDRYLHRMAGAKQVAEGRSRDQIESAARQARKRRWARFVLVLIVLAAAAAYWLYRGGGPIDGSS